MRPAASSNASIVLPMAPIADLDRVVVALRSSASEPTMTRPRMRPMMLAAATDTPDAVRNP